MAGPTPSEHPEDHPRGHVRRTHPGRPPAEIARSSRRPRSGRQATVLVVVGVTAPPGSELPPVPVRENAQLSFWVAIVQMGLLLMGVLVCVLWGRRRQFVAFVAVLVPKTAQIPLSSAAQAIPILAPWFHGGAAPSAAVRNQQVGVSWALQAPGGEGVPHHPETGPAHGGVMVPGRGGVRLVRCALAKPTGDQARPDETDLIGGSTYSPSPDLRDGGRETPRARAG